jgi:GTP:adenosylcobinamide-phosphate guanylyltransferase
LLDIDGTPMLERVIRTLRSTPCVNEILVSIDEPALVREIPTLTSMLDAGEFALITSESSPSRSVLCGLRELGGHGPSLVTTADHALLSREMVEHFLTAAEASDGDVAAGLVAATLIRARFPNVKRTYLHFRGESYSGANLFYFRGARALRAVEFWKRVESQRKRPWRLVGAFGLGTLLLFALGRLDLKSAFARASRVTGARLHAVEMPFAEAAVDVDKLSDLELVNEIVGARGARGRC